MKKIAVILFLLFPVLSYSAGTSPELNSAKEDNLFDFMLGVFPNQDGEINTYLFLGINYSSSFNSSVAFYKKNYSKLEEKVEEGDDVDEINSLDKIDVSVNVLEYITDIYSGTPLIKLSPGLTFDFIFEKKDYELNSHWDDAGITYLYFEKVKRENYSYMPGIKLDIIWAFKNFFEVTTGGAFIYSYDINNFEEFSTTSDPDPVEQAEAYYSGAYKVKYSSLGFRVQAGIRSYETGLGIFELAGTFLQKWGDSKYSTKEWDEVEEENVFEEFNSEERRQIFRLEVLYHMTFLLKGDTVPILKFGYEKQIVYVDDVRDDDYGYDNYDLGIAIKF